MPLGAKSRRAADFETSQVLPTLFHHSSSVFIPSASPSITMSLQTRINRSALILIMAQVIMDMEKVPYRLCPQSPSLNHVPIICLEREHFGKVFEYVSGGNQEVEFF